MLFLKNEDNYIYGDYVYEIYKKEKVLYLSSVCSKGRVINTIDNDEVGLIVLYVLNDLKQFFNGDIVITDFDGYWLEFIFKKKSHEKEYKFNIYISSSKDYTLYCNEIPCFTEKGGDYLIIKRGNLYNLKQFKKQIFNINEWEVVKEWEEQAKKKKEEELKKEGLRLISYERQKPKMIYYTVYEITDLTNGMKYIGKHKTNNLDDMYMGSGRLLKQNQEIKGIENFTKKILHLCKDEQHMAEMEAMEIEKVKAYENNMYYNLKKEK